MTVINNFLGNTAVDTIGKTNTAGRDNSFDRMLNEVDRRNRAGTDARSTANNDRTRANPSAGNGQNNRSGQAEGGRNTEQEARPLDNQSTGALTDETAYANIDDGSERLIFSDEVSKELVEDVACALQIAPYELMAVLLTLDIAPEELMEAKNVTLVIAEVLKAESPAELLVKEGVKDLFAEINEAVLTAYEKNSAELAQVKPADVPLAPVVTEDAALYAPVQTSEELLSPLIIQGEEVIAEEAPEEIFTTTTQTTAAQQRQSSGENQNPETAQNELFQNAEVELTMAAQPTVENRVVQGFNPINAEPPQAAANREVANQIFEKIKVDVKPGVSEIKMNLRPESLGEVSLRIASQNGIITAHFVAESQRVKEIIESNLNQLKDSLEEQGVTVSDLSVSVSTGNAQQQMNEFLKERSKSQARIANILASIDSAEALEPDEQEIYDNTLNIKV